MRIKDAVHFSPNFKVVDVDLSNADEIIEAFNDRFQHYYFEPARLLNESDNNDKYAFAAGTILMTTIDAITKLFWQGQVGERFRRFAFDLPGLIRNGRDDEYKSRFAHKFYDNFRNGLIHEGRIKDSGQFSYTYPTLETVQAGALVINPAALYSDIEFIYQQFLDKLSRNATFKANFVSNFKLLFQNEFQSFKGHPENRD